MDGLLVYADLHLSYLLDSKIYPVDNSCDTYWIYAQKLSVNFGGHTKGESTHDSSDIYREDTYMESWSFSRNFALPLPDENYNPNEINTWRSQIDKQQKEQGCSALVVIRDRRSVGGDVKVFPHFTISSVINKKTFRLTAKGYQKHTGNKIDLDRNGTQGCGFGFNGVILGVNFHSETLMKIDDYGYNLPDPVFSTQNFSLEGFGCSGQGNGTYTPKYYLSQVNTPYTTVHSDSEHIVSWSYNLSLAKGVNATIETASEDWRPKGGDESNIISIRAYIEEKEEKGIFKFILSEISKEKGIALNKGDEDSLDFEFEKNQAGFRQPIETSDGWEIESENKQVEASVSIMAKDYGAWAKLKAQIQVAGVWHDCKTDEGKTYVTVPYDKDEDHIADFWEKKYTIYSEPASADNDKEPRDVGDPAEPGDGFSNYEEYRGFFINDIWKTTDPTRKDIFIYDELGFGVGLFTELDLTVSLINQNEFNDDKFVNFNRGYGTLESQNGQKGIYLRGGFVEGSLGFAEGIGCPNVVGDITVDCLTIWKHAVFEVMGKSTDMYEYREIKDGNLSTAKGSVVQGYDTYYDVTITNAPIEYNASIEAAFLKLLNETIAHELGHGVNLTHHGEDRQVIKDNSDLENYLENYRNNDPMLEFIPGDTAVTGGIWSGDVSCVMRYGPPSNYLGWDNRIYAYPGNEGNASRSSYCTSKEGTGINAPPQRTEGGKPYPVAGNATRGACKAMVDLKGTHYGGN
ncbi:MAG: hypothetical protein K8S13_15175 [Desulfobacula sp.]|uniref:hypothetical protein n=1 Tax=Desulfobacula sp. TaxID=2593537 RepID=UPI0025C259BE|nr:hypothetical protein [Desulfobacula sp.]MCD4721181.1 hypothetical protein [Desulfobacula sp.]